MYDGLKTMKLTDSFSKCLIISMPYAKPDQSPNTFVQN